MALRLGVGDTFTICKGVVDACRASHDKPKEIQCIIAEMELIRTHLKVLETQIGDERSFASTRPDISPVIKRSLEPIHRDLSQMKDLVHEHNRRQSVHVLDQVRYLVLYKSKLDGFQGKLAAHRTSISVIGDLIEDQSPAERRKSIMKLDSLVEEHGRRGEGEQVYDQNQEQVEESLEYLFPHAEAARHLSRSEILEQLEDDLPSKGMSPQQTKEYLFPMINTSPPQSHQLGTVPVSLMPKPAFRLDVFTTGAYPTQKNVGQPNERYDNYESGKVKTKDRETGARADPIEDLLPPHEP